MDTFATKDKMSKCLFCYSETSTTTPPINQQLCEHHLTKSNSNDCLLLRLLEWSHITSNPTQGPSPSIALSTWISDHGPTPRGLASWKSAPVLRPKFFLWRKRLCEDTNINQKIVEPRTNWRIHATLSNKYTGKLEMSKNWSTIAELLASRLTNPEIPPFPIWTSITKP